MNPEEKKDNSTEFGKVIDALHSKQKLPSLRTYQGDVAEFIKEKNESVISIVVKDKEKKEETIKKENLFPIKKPAPVKSNFTANLTTLLVSVLLIAGAIVAIFYAYKVYKSPPPVPAVVENEIIPSNNSITLANVTSKNIGSELTKLSPVDGINILKISDTNGSTIQKAKVFFNFLNVSLPAALGRTLQDDYAVGVFSKGDKTSNFLVITVDDFGGAFSAMLGWEKNMEKDLVFLNFVEPSINTVATMATTTATITTSSIATTTATTTGVIIPMKLEVFSWKDIIVKNKDTRGLVNQKNQAKIAYTFLDKNTILITNNLSAIGEISSIYASRSFAR